MKIDDIAVICGVPSGTIKSRLNRARRLVREWIMKAERYPSALRETTAGDVENWARSLREKLVERGHGQS